MRDTSAHLSALRRVDGARVNTAPGVRQTSLRPALRPCPVALADARRAAVVAALSRDEVARMLADGWPGLMLRKFRSDEACGAAFGRTRQTGTNWRSGLCKPDGPAVVVAAMRWPDEFAALFRRAA